jgi:hypothetical protein
MFKLSKNIEDKVQNCHLYVSRGEGVILSNNIV